LLKVLLAEGSVSHELINNVANLLNQKESLSLRTMEIDDLERQEKLAHNPDQTE
jgi:hypothetical protein